MQSMNKRKLIGMGLILTAGSILLVLSCNWNTKSPESKKAKRPNILFVIADDQSFPYASAYGARGVKTPAFDGIAQSGILFNNAFVAAPQCSPSRAAILTGKNIWQLEEAGTHGSYFPKKFTVFTDLLENAGYWIGFTGKPWAPGNWKGAGWKRNPVGPEYNDKKLAPPYKGISNIDYYGNFVDFYDQRKEDEPFFFWFGSHEPHRIYEEGSGKRAGKNIADALVPGFLPNDSVVRSDIEDYALEIEWFDSQLGRMIEFLRQKGELENTMIVVTSDNGMPFPSAKANLLEYGTHVPLAISWPSAIQKGQVRNDLVSLVDLAPTFLNIAGVDNIPAMTGKSMVNMLLNKNDSKDPSPKRDFVLTGRERHTHARPDNLGYPSRAIRTDQYLLILNLKPERWPAGNPPIIEEKALSEEPEAGDGESKGIGMGYNDIDDPSPTKSFMIRHQKDWQAMFDEGFSKRPAEQLFDIRLDPGCTNNLAANPKYDAIRNELSGRLKQLLTQQGDPRMLGYGDIFESYPRFGAMRDWPGFKERGQYNKAYAPKKD
ncbi:MAG: sulfatase-like hydrolase/transferase [Terrimonas sp.]|nr:sulfatase-like hydrolase/transferase [Terrimonas sp.]